MNGSSFAKLAAFIVAGALIFILYLYFFVGFGGILEVFRSVNPYEYSIYYSLTIIAIVLSMIFYSMSWNEFMKGLSIKMNLKKAFLYCWLGNFVDLILPFEAISGEITRVYLVHRETRDPSGKIIASVVGHRIITTLITLVCLFFSSTFLIIEGEYEKIGAGVLYLLSIVILGSLFLIAALLYLSLKKDAAEKLIDFLAKAAGFLTRGRLNPPEIKEKMHQHLLHFHRGIESFGKNRVLLVKAAAYSFLAWFFHLIIYFLVFYALGFSGIAAKIYETIVVYSISVAIQTIPIALPLGIVEIVMTSLYTFFKIPVALSGTATLLIRVVTFWLQILVGYAIAQWMGVKNLLGKNRKETLT